MTIPSLVASLALVVALPACSAPSPLSGVLDSRGPAADRADKLQLYAFLVGHWELRVVGYAEDGTRQESRGELHAGWVLEGRAIQDVWIMPPRAERPAAGPLQELPGAGNFYGSTLRTYDPGLDAWHIQWSDPVAQFYAQQIGRAEGADIVQVGELPGVGTLRWRFTEIRPDSFHWIGDVSSDGGKTWEVQVEIFAERRAG